ncbi:LysR substrate-binding domain-containing protein [Marinomonas balearica]|uniref:DNA-binding transcriptional LysR family regulator n=1 Tax=Marinomonas balearica TaxID=491947 RepID=A0A4R6MJY6_9GAMM|nr:LysR substrate-binding domain-containing protein [Marinomonas balearica]TDP01271.1 DNA-binding transcriptional LysR family regulator [Marinomonas balearica]
MSNFHRKRSLPPLSALPAFEAAARHQSFTKAAEELHVTHGAVSRAVLFIEERLGIKLFTRRNRRVFLTTEGQRLFKTTERILDELNQTTEDMQRHQSHSPFLVVSCEPSLAMRWLMPRLGEFHALHPELNVELRMAGGPIDLIASGCDLAIRRNDFGIPDDHQVTDLFEETSGPVCTSLYWSSIDSNLDKATLLYSRTRPNAWEEWRNATNAITSQKETQQTAQYFDHFFYALQAAQSHLGITIGSQPIISDDLTSKRLMAPFGLNATGYRYVMLSLNALTIDPRIDAFQTWLLTHLNQSQIKKKPD